MYFMIKNPGLADPNGITLLGASTSRFNSQAIGTFGSGFKYSLATLLRNGIEPVMSIDLLKMQFKTQPVRVADNKFDQILVEYSGKDHTGKTHNYTKELNMVTEWGVNDWTNLDMPVRELVANAIDGCLANGKSFNEIEMNIVDKPRASAGHTCIFLPIDGSLQKSLGRIKELFLHFTRPEDLKKKIIRKSNPDVFNVYKDGVRVRSTNKHKSVFDYNFGKELILDESRNANDSEISWAVSKLIANASSKDLIEIFKAIAKDKELFEAKIADSYLSIYAQANNETKLAWLTAAKAAFGERGVATTDSAGPIYEMIMRKGFDPYVLPLAYVNVLTKFGGTTDKNILNGLELGGFEDSEPTQDMINALHEVWNVVSTYQLTNGKNRPPIRSFNPIMNGGCQVLGMYKDGTVYIHSDLGVGRSHALVQTVFEELVHHITGASDMSRDFQDYILRLLTKIVF